MQLLVHEVWFCFSSFWEAELGAVLSEGHIFQFSGENYTIATALKFSSYVSDHKQHHDTGPLRMGSGLEEPTATSQIPLRPSGVKCLQI